MDPLFSTLSQIGLGVATNAVYDFLKGIVGKQIGKHQLVKELENRITMHGISVRTETIIRALAENGLLIIDQTHLHADQNIVFGSVQGRAVFGNNSTMTTNRTVITAGAGAFIETNGNAQVRHNEDGSITFHVEEGKK